MTGWSVILTLLVCLVSNVLSGIKFESRHEYEDDMTDRWERSLNSVSPKLNKVPSIGSKMNSGPGCRRACTPDAPSLVCRYHFVMEYYNTMGLACGNCPNNTRDCYERQCVTTNGVPRGILTINRRMPGPSIQVCQGDTVVVDLENRIAGHTTAIHWHGLLQEGSPYMDGVPMLTQCPIPEGTSFRYVYNATEVGTFFWHSHDGLQKMDGLVGSLIVRSPRDPSLRRYFWDLQQHVMVIQDWLHEYTAERLPGPRRGPRRGQRPDSLLINGRGRFINPITGESNNIPMAEFRVSPGFRYRFRIIHAGCLICPLQLSVQNHRITLIATDGSAVRPVTADTLILLPGERYDVVIRTNQPVATYLIHLKALGECNDTRIYQEALLRYEGANVLQSIPTVGYTGFPEGRILNALNAACGAGQNGVCVSQLQAEMPLNKPLRKNPLMTAQNIIHLTIGFDFKLFTFQEQFRNKLFYKHYEPATPAELDFSVAGRMNLVSLALPPSPVLSQPEAWRQLCESGSSRCCDNIAPFVTHRECFNVISVPLGAVVEILFLDNMNSNRTMTHPIHIHGFMFVVTAMGTREQRNRGLAEARDNIVLQDNPAMKDTVAVPSGGFTRVRFHATNPGYWLIHCHILFHLDTGMAAVLRVGEQTDLPPVPDNFPKCGNFLPAFK